MKKTIAFCGTRGIPANYGGFETAVDEITKRLSDTNDCHVFCRSDDKQDSKNIDNRRAIYVRGSKSKKLDTFVSSIRTGAYILKHRKEYDFIFWFNNANLPGILISKLSGVPMAVNTDGLEWRRAKWSWPFKLYYFLSTILICMTCRVLIADSVGIQSYYKKTFFRKSEMIPYGVPAAQTLEPSERDLVLDRYELKANQYFLQITRFEPDNLPMDVIKSFVKSGIGKQGYKMVLIGYKQDSAYANDIYDMRSDEVIVLPAIYDKRILQILRENAFGYVHGNSVGGTNPALLEAMMYCKRVLAIDIVFSQEVLGERGIYFNLENLPSVFNSSLSTSDSSIYLRERVFAKYNWDEVAASYLKIASKEKAMYKPIGQSIDA